MAEDQTKKPGETDPPSAPPAPAEKASGYVAASRISHGALVDGAVVETVIEAGKPIKGLSKKVLDDLIACGAAIPKV